jgi:Lrp/AsnC family transcriptional regulator, leucine-responsive regulatory protein
MPGKRRNTNITASVSSAQSLDATNLRLLRELIDDPRASIATLARRVGMSAPAITERLQRLHDSGVISGYRLELNPAALGLPVTAYVRVRPAAGQLARVAGLANELPQVVECHRITGDDCFLIKVHLAGIDQLDTVLDRFLAYGQTTTSLVQSTPVPLRAPRLPGD